MNFCGRARRRLARHARRARIPLVSRALVVEEEFVDVDVVTNEVHDAEPDRTLHMEVSDSDGDPEADVSSLAAPPAPARRMPALRSAALSINSGREVRLAPRSKRKPKAKAKSRAAASTASALSAASTASGSSARRGQDSFDTLPTSSTERLESDGWGAAGFPSSYSLVFIFLHMLNLKIFERSAAVEIHEEVRETERRGKLTRNSSSGRLCQQKTCLFFVLLCSCKSSCIHAHTW